MVGFQLKNMINLNYSTKRHSSQNERIVESKGKNVWTYPLILVICYLIFRFYVDNSKNLGCFLISQIDEKYQP